MMRFSGVLAAILVLMLQVAPPAVAQSVDRLTWPSVHSVRATLDRFAVAVREAGWVIYTEIDLAVAARAVGMPLSARTVVLFGNPHASPSAVQEQATLAIDLPTRVLVWEDDHGYVFVTNNARTQITSPVRSRAIAWRRHLTASAKLTASLRIWFAKRPGTTPTFLSANGAASHQFAGLAGPGWR